MSLYSPMLEAYDAEDYAHCGGTRCQDDCHCECDGCEFADYSCDGCGKLVPLSETVSGHMAGVGDYTACRACVAAEGNP